MGYRRTALCLAIAAGLALPMGCVAGPTTPTSAPSTSAVTVRTTPPPPAPPPCDKRLLLAALDRAERPRYSNFDEIGFEIGEFSCLGQLGLGVVVHKEANGLPAGTHISEALFRYDNGWTELVRLGPDLNDSDAEEVGVSHAQLTGLRELLHD